MGVKADPELYSGLISTYFTSICCVCKDKHMQNLEINGVALFHPNRKKSQLNLKLIFQISQVINVVFNSGYSDQPISYFSQTPPLT